MPNYLSSRLVEGGASFTMRSGQVTDQPVLVTSRMEAKYKQAESVASAGAKRETYAQSCQLPLCRCIPLPKLRSNVGEGRECEECSTGQRTGRDACEEGVGSRRSREDGVRGATPTREAVAHGPMAISLRPPACTGKLQVLGLHQAGWLCSVAVARHTCSCRSCS